MREGAPEKLSGIPPAPAVLATHRRLARGTSQALRTGLLSDSCWSRRGIPSIPPFRRGTRGCAALFLKLYAECCLPLTVADLGAEVRDLPEGRIEGIVIGLLQLGSIE